MDQRERRQRFVRAMRILIGVLVFMEVLVAVSVIELGLNWLVVALLIVIPLMAVYLAYLIRRVSEVP